MSQLSLSTPKLSTTRAVEATHPLNEQPTFRAQRSVGARYLLKADIARYYPSIYGIYPPRRLAGKLLNLAYPV